MKVLTLILLGLFAVSCGGRLPSARTSQGVAAKYFKKYGKQYKESDFGRHRLDKVEIEEIALMQKNLASVYAFIYLAEGGPVYRARLTLKKKAVGWRAIAWENLGSR